MTDSRRPDEHSAEVTAIRLHERIYVTFTSLAVILTLGLHADGLGAGEAALTLVVSALGTVLAAYAADLMSHVVVRGGFPSDAEGRTMRGASIGALSVTVPPLLAIGLAGLDLYRVETALHVATAILVGTLGLVAWLGVRRAHGLAPAQRLVALGAMVLLGVVVVGLKLLAH
ncbi:hypothetical protein RB608_24435 [Nocardioides sp. LHD-245]|uniref:hypothetical protein n=1 Tax=Nocardioides sp. LHD-245 TaxID=3051387 RepID=UPI0027DECF90|nr:hypothetical protein [Nocardioides sp. LHD-245]